jgi:hypothetical protein
LCWKLSYDEQTCKPIGTIYNNAYADDIDIVGRCQSAVQDACLALERDAAKVGLKINEQNIKYMIAARNDLWGKSRHFEVVKEFVYLGSLMTPKNDMSLEIQRRIQTANRCFFGLRKNIYSRATFHARQNSPFTRP